MPNFSTISAGGPISGPPRKFITVRIQDFAAKQCCICNESIKKKESVLTSIFYKNRPDLTGSSVYSEAFDIIKKEKAVKRYGEDYDPVRIRYQIGDTYYKRLLLPAI